MRRLASVLVVVGAVLGSAAGAAQACACGPPPLFMTADPGSVAVGEPVTFTIGKTNVLPSDLEWSVRDHLPASMEFVSASSSQGTCGTPSEGSNNDVVQCDLGVIPSGGGATIDVTAIPTVPGEVTNYAADNGENEASATVTVE